MPLHYLACFFAGIFLTNAIPHGVNGVSGRPFQSPFAKPPGEGLSSATSNVIWAFINLAAGYALLYQATSFTPARFPDALSLGAGGLVMAVFSARHFGKFHGGNTS